MNLVRLVITLTLPNICDKQIYFSITLFFLQTVKVCLRDFYFISNIIRGRGLISSVSFNIKVDKEKTDDGHVDYPDVGEDLRNETVVVVNDWEV